MTELHGKIGVTFNKEKLEQLCRNLATDFDTRRFDIVAVRLFSGKEHVLTVYAADKDNTSTTITPGRYPVKKFKFILSSPDEFYEVVEAFNFTVSNGEYQLDDMTVMNK
jgi:hypothetical protein